MSEQMNSIAEIVLRAMCRNDAPGVAGLGEILRMTRGLSLSQIEEAVAELVAGGLLQRADINHRIAMQRDRLPPIVSRNYRLTLRGASHFDSMPPHDPR